MEFITIFCILLALGFILWILGVVALFVIKAIIGTGGILYFSGKKIVDGLQKLLSYPFSRNHVDGMAETKVGISMGAKPAHDTVAKVDFNEDRSLYHVRTEWGSEGTIKRYSDYNIIYDLKYSNPWFNATIVNPKRGLRHVCSNRLNYQEVILEIERVFKDWAEKHSETEFIYGNAK